MSAKPSFRERQFVVREEAILAVTLRLLGSKGYDPTTMDEVAAEVGIAKASLYKHFSSKESLACAVMRHLLADTLAFTDRLDVASPLAALKTVLRWALHRRVAGDFPTLPASNSSLRAALLADADYLGALARLTGQLSAWIEAARARGELRPELPTEVVLLSLYARTCDPAIDYLRQSGTLDDEAIVEMMLAVFFDGVARP